MGNCSHKSCSPCNTIRASSRVRVWTESGQSIEFEGPKSAHEVLCNFPVGYGIFLGGGGGETRLPLEREEKLENGRVYYALPLGNSNCRRRAKQYFMSPSTATVESLPSKRSGVWRVKLAISVEELEEILAGQVNMESLMHRVRMGQGFNMQN